MIFKYGKVNKATAVIVSTTRKMIAAALPQKMAFFCWAGGKLRDANAITTALSPDNKILATMIESNAAQKAASENAEKSIMSPYFYIF
jgi:hypothetical protein